MVRFSIWFHQILECKTARKFLDLPISLIGGIEISLLSFMIDHNLNFSKQACNMSIATPFLSTSIIVQLLKTFILSYFDYCSTLLFKFEAKNFNDDPKYRINIITSKIRKKKQSKTSKSCILRNVANIEKQFFIKIKCKSS
ncbi:hypothetical protein BpHYR1_046003 [Brachionus plicatilis]|uniref:Uncharacterized protein n=1 Tax=Brachionus plicatilis TaxID=10195 RepID=A0A3M7PEI0_BRAPC|nr:hypothetical protein BpHYR1_046003 [Brachionus plicatilis]